MGEYVYTIVQQETQQGKKEFEIMSDKFSIGFAAMLYDIEDVNEDLILSTSVGKALFKLKSYLTIIECVQTPIAKRIEPVVQYFHDYLSNFSKESILISDCYCLTKEEIIETVNSYKVAFKKISTKEVTKSKYSYEITNEIRREEYNDAIRSEKLFKQEFNLDCIFIDRLCKFKNMKYVKEFFFYIKNNDYLTKFIKDLKRFEDIFPFIDNCLYWEIEKGKYVVYTLFVAKRY